jgi:hypothetical protein
VHISPLVNLWAYIFIRDKRDTCKGGAQMTKSAEEVLLELINGKYVFTDPRVKKQLISQALKELLALIEGEMPKKKYHKTVSMLEFNPDMANQIEGYNQALTDTLTKLREIFKEAR